MEGKQTELETEKCNVADDAGITQSQARDTRHRRMQEVNSLCTDSGPLRANTVLCHSKLYSLLVCCGCMFAYAVIDLVFQYLTKRLVGKNVSEMTYFVSGGT